MRIITVTGYKGGVGKSTTAVHVATFLADHGPTLLVDGDPNRTAISWSKRGSLPFDVASIHAAQKASRDKVWMVIDTPARPDSDELSELAEGCDLLVLPTTPDVVSLEPMLQTSQVLEQQGAMYRFLITIVPPRPSREGEMVQHELQQAGVPVFDSLIRRTAGFPHAARDGVSVRELADARMRVAWQDYARLGREILEVLNGQ